MRKKTIHTHAKFWLPGLLLLLGTIQAMAQIGGNLTPLLYSTHTYRIEMDDPGYQYSWGLYPEGTTEEQVQEGSVPALIPNTDYTATPAYKSGNYSYWRIQFDKNIAEWGSYVIGYKETTQDNNKCLSARILNITIYPCFDVDVFLADEATNAQRCGDETEQLQAPDFDTLQSTFVYRVDITSPETPPGYAGGGIGYWHFRFYIKAEGRGGAADATIYSITVNYGSVSSTFTVAPGSSSYDADIQITPATTSSVEFTVVYNEAPGVTQDVSFFIDDIQGAFSEPDIDRRNNAPELNTVNHVLFAMPNVGPITAWEP